MLTRPKSSWELRAEKAEAVLREIASYDSPEWLRRHCEKSYGLSYEEALEGAYENVLNEAKHAVKGLRRKRRAQPPPADAVDPHASSTGTPSTREK